MDVDVEEEIDLHLKVDELDKGARSRADRSPAHVLPSIDERSRAVDIELQRAASLGLSQPSVESLDDVVNELQRLSSIKTNKSKSVQRTHYRHSPSDVSISGWSLDAPSHRSKEHLQCSIRGFFTRQLLDGSHSIVIRGYDWFYASGETAATTWDTMQDTTVGPYEVTLKESGVLVWMGALEGHLLVTSHNAVGHAQRESHASGEECDTEPRTPQSPLAPSRQTCNQHVLKGEEWAVRHAQSAGKTKQDLINWLSQHHVTVVCELVDDDVQERFLEQPSDRKGLYVHGINSNTVAFHSWSSSRVSEFAKAFGFHFHPAPVYQSLADVKVLADKCAETGTYEGRHVEGFVVRCRLKASDTLAGPPAASGSTTTDSVAAAAPAAPGAADAEAASEPQSFFFKVKFNVPLLLFREWRELTKRVLLAKPVVQPEHPISQKYLAWVSDHVKSNPAMFDRFLDNKGVVAVRDAFLQSVGLPPDPASLAEALSKHG